MKLPYPKQFIALFMLIAFFPLTSFAHLSPQDATYLMGFYDGFLHPLTGLDHMVAMLLVGIWSAMNTQKWWVAPISFASLLLIGAIIGMQGVAIAATEYLVAASLFIIGIMVAIKRPLAAYVGAIIVGFFALFHGLAHGSELSNSVSALTGMVLATALLHMAGLLIGYLLIKQANSNWSARLIGGTSSLLGLALLTGIV